MPYLNSLLLTVLLAIAIPAGAMAEDDLRPFLDRHCVGCHSGRKPDANLLLTELKNERADGANNNSVVADRAEIEIWKNVLDKLDTGEMPSEDSRID